MDELRQVTINYSDSNFLNLEGEEVHLVLRPHGLTLMPSIVLLGFLVIALVSAITAAGVYLSLSLLSILGLLSVIIFGLFILGQTILGWYLHLYVVTSRKILELSYSPFGDCIINNILLDQVRCTEVDMHSPGFFYQLLDIGNISITFDRPTHQQEFLIEKIKDYRKVGNHISTLLVPHEKPFGKDLEALWIRDRTDPARFTYTETLTPARR